MTPHRPLIASLVSSAFTSFGADTFNPGCVIPFKAIETDDLEIDKRCGIDGGSDDAAKIAESNAKNNSCAAGTAVPITFSTFTKLEAKTTDAARAQVKEGRSVLRGLLNGAGEGT